MCYLREEHIPCYLCVLGGGSVLGLGFGGGGRGGNGGGGGGGGGGSDIVCLCGGGGRGDFCANEGITVIE